MIHPTATIGSNVKIGENTKIWHYTHVMDDITIGSNVIIAQNCFIAADIPDGCKIQNNVSVYKGVELSKNVFLGPSCITTNVVNPRAFIEKKSEFKKTIIGEGATIGANATIICGVKIGEYAMVGAGAVVTKDVEPYSLVVGNPARKIGRVEKDGSTVKFEERKY